MKDQKYKLHSTDLNDYYIPLSEIKVEVYKVKAKNREDAIHRVTNNLAKFSKVRIIRLLETLPNCVFNNKNINEHELLNKQIDHYQIHDKELKNFPMKIVK